MNLHTVKVPGTLTLTNALAFSREVAALPDDLVYLILDFSAWADVKPYELPIQPFGMLIISQSIQQLKQRVPGVTIAPTYLPDNEIESYAAHMGFFKASNIHLGKEPGQARGSPTYLPLTRIEKPGLLQGWEIEERSHELAQKLTQQAAGPLVSTLKYSFTEIIRNVAEHARSPEYWLCAQYWLIARRGGDRLTGQRARPTRQPEEQPDHPRSSGGRPDSDQVRADAGNFRHGVERQAAARR